MIYDAIIVGSGPAAYNCAIYLKSYKVLLIEGKVVGNNGPGGQLTTTTNVDNYPCFVSISGPDLVSQMKEHAAVETKEETVTEVTKMNEEDKTFFSVRTDEAAYTARSVVVASGASARRLFVEGTGDNEFWNNGVSACAVCDGFLFRGAVVAVIGGGDSAMEESLFLSRICKKVFLVHRRNKFKARFDMLEKVKKCENVEFLTPFELVKAEGGESLERIVLSRVDENGDKKELKTVDVTGLFFGIGHDPNTNFLTGVEMKEGGYIKTNKLMETNVEGLFACGDVQDAKYKQANTAAAAGCVAALSVVKYLKSTS